MKKGIKKMNEYPSKNRMISCSECSLVNLMQPCEACENNPKRRKYDLHPQLHNDTKINNKVNTK
jgi:hypothetical protein